MTPRLVYRDANGRELTLDDLDVTTPRMLAGSGPKAPIPAEVTALHQQGREAGARSELDRALELLEQAHRLAPQWAYPIYDIAFTYLLKGNMAKAEEHYCKVDALEPRGFFITKTFLDGLRREREGLVPPGFCLAYASLEGMADRAQKRATLRGIVGKFPRFPQAWKDLLPLLDDDDARLDAIEHGLAHDPDGETRGMLLINKGLILDRRGERDAALRILGDLALDPQSTLSSEVMAKMALVQMVSRWGGQA